MTFEELRNAKYKNPTVAMFYGPACAPCDRMKPRVSEVCEKLSVRLEMFSSSAEMPVLRGLGIRAVPAVVVVHPDGTTKVAFVGEEKDIQKCLAAAGVRVG
jgi:thiol-disulfide isomerase/thioredoxin